MCYTTHQKHQQQDYAIKYMCENGKEEEKEPKMCEVKSVSIWYIENEYYNAAFKTFGDGFFFLSSLLFFHPPLIHFALVVIVWSFELNGFFFLLAFTLANFRILLYPEHPSYSFSIVIFITFTYFFLLHLVFFRQESFCLFHRLPILFFYYIIVLYQLYDKSNFIFDALYVCPFSI